MLQTQPQHWTCTCGEKYEGIEGLKYNHKNGEARVVWKKVRIIGSLKQVAEQFECVKCGKPVQI